MPSRTSITRDDWRTSSESGEPLRVSSHTPDAPRAHAIVAHGLKGFKEYGFLPVLCESLARRGVAAHRFNFSHSGIGEDPATFQRPDLFERDTWRTQARDALTMMRAVRDRAGALPIVMIGHSRGGASSLLAAADCFERGAPPPVAVISLSAPSSLNRMGERDRAAMLERGFVEMPSARTGQTLRVGRAWLEEQLDDPAWHDLPSRCASIVCAALVAHGGRDQTVPSDDARTLANALPRSTLTIINEADHVWNTPNPAPPDAADSPSPPLATLLDDIDAFLTSTLG